MTSRVLSLAAGCLPEVGPVEMVEAAAAGGWSHTGLWIEPHRNWHAETGARVRRALERENVAALDVEVIWLNPGGHDEDHDRVICWGAEVGARAALVVSSIDDVDVNRRRWERLCRRAEREGLRVVLEFLPITSVRTLADARAIVEHVGHPDGGLLIDPIHLKRTGGTPEDVAALDPAWLPYAQFCDGVAELEDEGPETLLADAVDGRDVPGAGELPLAELLEALPADLALSLEIRSKAWRERYPEAAERSRELRKACGEWFQGVAGA